MSSREFNRGKRDDRTGSRARVGRKELSGEKEKRLPRQDDDRRTDVGQLLNQRHGSPKRAVPWRIGRHSFSACAFLASLPCFGAGERPNQCNGRRTRAAREPSAVSQRHPVPSLLFPPIFCCSPLLALPLPPLALISDPQTM
jgi:hypothetical protein